MGQSRATFDQSKITALRENLPPFSAETALVDPADTALGQYLDFYQLPIQIGRASCRERV